MRELDAELPEMMIGVAVTEDTPLPGGHVPERRMLGPRRAGIAPSRVRLHVTTEGSALARKIALLLRYELGSGRHTLGPGCPVNDELLEWWVPKQSRRLHRRLQLTVRQLHPTSKMRHHLRGVHLSPERGSIRLNAVQSVEQLPA